MADILSHLWLNFPKGSDIHEARRFSEIVHIIAQENILNYKWSNLKFTNGNMNQIIKCIWDTTNFSFFMTKQKSRIGKEINELDYYTGWD